MPDIKMLNFESQGDGNNREFTTVLRLTNIQDEDQGRYQCVISNHFGSIYSRKAKVTVHGKLVVSKLENFIDRGMG